MYRKGSAHRGSGAFYLGGGISRFSCFVLTVSLLCGVLVFFFFKSSVIPGTSGPLCAVVIADESQDDRLIRTRLARGGMEAFVSESSQFVPADDFGDVKMIPLDSFGNEFEEFDPRNDGYAAKLRDFFVRDGKRFFFLPLDDSSGFSISSFRKNLADLLDEIPFSFTALGQRRPIFLYFVLLAAACGCALIFSRSKRLFVYGLPVLLASAWVGISAFLFSALLAGLWELLREPFHEMSAAHFLKKIASGPAYISRNRGRLKSFFGRLRPFAPNFLLVVLFLAFLVFYLRTGDLPVIPLTACCAGFFFLYFLASSNEARKIKKTRHIPFVPSPLFPSRVRTFHLFPLLLPFGAGAALAVLLPMVFPSGNYNRLSGLKSENLVTTEDYSRHVEFVDSFPYRSLNPDFGRDMGEEPKEYLRYYLGDDGLIAGGLPYGAGGKNILPPFPLEKLMDFLVNYTEQADGDSGLVRARRFTPAEFFRNPVWGRFEEWIPALVIFVICILDLIWPGPRGRKMKRIPVAGDKRIAA